MILAAAVHMIPDLQTSGGESIAQRDIDVAAVFAIDHDLHSRQRDDQPHRDLSAPAFLIAQRFGEYLAAANSVANCLEFARLVSNITFERVGTGYASQRNRYRTVHDSTRLLFAAGQL
jgi:hypothetical protein